MTKIVLNKCFGGFGLSDKALERLMELGVPLIEEGEKCNKLHVKRSDLGSKYHLGWSLSPVEKRTHPLIIQVVEELGSEANGRFASLVIKDPPLEPEQMYLKDYDGVESIIEQGREW